LRSWQRCRGSARAQPGGQGLTNKKISRESAQFEDLEKYGIVCRGGRLAAKKKGSLEIVQYRPIVHEWHLQYDPDPAAQQ
jgi:hypothetical protein